MLRRLTDIFLLIEGHVPTIALKSLLCFPPENVSQSLHAQSRNLSFLVIFWVMQKLFTVLIGPPEHIIASLHASLAVSLVQVWISVLHLLSTHCFFSFLLHSPLA